VAAVLYIWVRATADWADVEAFRAQLRPDFEPKVELWNATFDMPFHLFRAEVARIARLNQSRVAGAVRADWNQIPEGGLVLPVDDDDWFAPHVGEALENEHDPAAEGYYWTSTFLEVPIDLRHRLDLIRRRVLRMPPVWACATNNYALVKGPDRKVLLDSHPDASRWVEGEGAAHTQRLERRLSAMNRTLASETSLAFPRPPIDRARLIRKYRGYKRLYRRRQPPELAWTQPYVEMMSALMQRLNVR
jgi:hypothetical protein